MLNSEKTKKELKEEDRKFTKKWYVAGILSIVSAMGLPFLIIAVSKTNYTVEQIGKLGPVGDFFGGATIGLLSIATIFFIIHTISIQSRELSLQRAELSLTRKEMKDTRRVHESSHKTMMKQQFESTFFNMLSLHNEIVNSIHFIEGGTVYNGRAIFKRLKEYLKNKLKRIEENSPQDQFTRLHALEEAISITAKDFSETTSHYFKNIYTLLTFLEQEKILTDLEKEKYIQIIKAQLSPYELVYLLYLSFKVENQPFLLLTRKYSLFREMDKDLLLQNGDYDMYCHLTR